MLWLVLTWLTLIALWGASEHWGVADLRHRLADARHHRAEDEPRPRVD